MFFSLFLTGSIIEFSQVGAGFIDGIVISRFLGPLAMAAEGIVHPIFSVLGIVSGFLAIGMQVKCTQAIGRGSRSEYCRFVSATVYVGAIVSLVIMGLCFLFSRQFAVFFGATGNAANLVDDASKYLIGIGVGVPPLIMNAILAPALQLDSGQKVVRTGAIVGACSNVVMDLIAVRMGWGILGIGLATGLSSYINLLYMCLFFLRKDRSLHFVKPNISAREFVRMLTNGSETAVKRIANTIRPMILNAIIIFYGGAMAMSVLSIRNNLSNLVEIFGAGIASAVSLLTCLYYGEINEESIGEVNSYEHKMILLFSGAICAFMIIAARPVAWVYVGGHSESSQMTVFTIRMLALQNPLQALVASRIKYLQAIHKKKNMTILIAMAQVVYVILSAFILGNLYGVYGILACYTVSDAAVLVTVYIAYAIKSHSFLPRRKDFLNLPDEFHLAPGDVISLDIRNMEDVTLCSEQIMLFCKGHKIDNKISYYSALAFEELSSNIVKYGFPDNRVSNPVIDLRAVITDNSFVIRMRDNCPKYDVTKQIALAKENSSDPTHNIGTRIISEIATDITYLHTFETNSIIISYNLG